MYINRLAQYLSLVLSLYIYVDNKPLILFLFFFFPPKSNYEKFFKARSGKKIFLDSFDNYLFFKALKSFIFYFVSIYRYIAVTIYYEKQKKKCHPAIISNNLMSNRIYNMKKIFHLNTNISLKKNNKKAFVIILCQSSISINLYIYKCFLTKQKKFLLISNHKRQ